MKTFGSDSIPLPNAVAGLLLLLTFPVLASAQQVIGSSPLFASSTSSGLGLEKSELPAKSDIGSAFANLGPITRWGAISVRPSLLYRITYGDGLLLPGQTEEQSSVIHTTTASVLFEIGEQWTVNYALTNVENSNPFLRDSLDHDISLGWQLVHGDWSFGVSQLYRTNSPLLAETGQQIDQATYSTAVNVGYAFGSKSFLDLSVARRVRLVDAAYETPQWTDSDWRTWSTSIRLHYRLSQRLQLGAGAEFTNDDVSNSSGMSAVQPHIQATWRPSPKISIQGKYGVEWRRIVEGDAGDISNPVYSGSIRYQPTETTSISLSASQSVAASYFANQASKTRTLGATFAQRLLTKLFFQAEINRTQTEYIATAMAFFSGRDDSFTAYSARISSVFAKRGSLAVFTNRSKNLSSTVGFGFSSFQIGTEIGYRF